MESLISYINESIFSLGKKPDVDFISVDMLNTPEYKKLIKDTREVVMLYFTYRVSPFFGGSDRGFDIADPMVWEMFDRGKLCKELRKLGWSAKTPNYDAGKEVGKNTMFWCFQLKLFDIPTDACIACWVKWNTPEQDDRFSNTYVTLCRFDEKKQMPDTSAELFKITEEEILER